MIVDLSCDCFRNIAAVHLEAHPRFNVFEGDNGQGKTNLLEAIYLIAALRSFRDARVATMIAWGEDTATVRATVQRREVSRTVGVELSRRGKRVAVDGKVIHRAADWLGQLGVVVFGPEDLALTKGEPSLRRRFMDRAVFGIWPAFLEEARAYRAALRSRNQLLRNAAGQGLDPEVLAAFDEELIRRGARVVHRRLSYLRAFRGAFDEVFRDITAGQVAAEIAYSGGPEVTEELEEPDLAGALRARLERTRETDLRRGYTSTGPHADDLSFKMAGRSARHYASQGQHRAFSLALKIAELRRMEAATAVEPMLLLDDVSSELDEHRNAQLMEHLDQGGGQVFITTTDRRWIRVAGASRVFTVKDGDVSC